MFITDHSWLQVNEDGTRHVLPSAGLAEEGVEAVISSSDRLVAGHLAVRLDPMFQTIQLPAGVAHLHSGLAHVDG